MKLAQPTHPHFMRNYCRQTFPLVGGDGDPPAALRRRPLSKYGRDGKKDGILVVGRCDCSHHRSQGQEGGAVPVGFDHCVQCITPPVGPIVSRTQTNLYCHSTPCHWRHAMSALLSPRKKKNRVKLAR